MVPDSGAVQSVLMRLTQPLCLCHKHSDLLQHELLPVGSAQQLEALPPPFRLSSLVFPLPVG